VESDRLRHFQQRHPDLPLSLELFRPLVMTWGRLPLVDLVENRETILRVFGAVISGAQECQDRQQMPILLRVDPDPDNPENATGLTF